MIDYKEKTLKNGLRVIVNSDRTTELVAVNMLYKVGSKNEDEEHTGFAHLFEHLMFSGSRNYPEFDVLLNSIGGESNAFTSSDITNFYITVPYIYLETVLEIEADRMKNLIIDGQHLAVQKKVVTEEFKQRYLNQPYGDLYKLMRELSFKVHPYKWQTIGKDISHIENATLDIVREFYNTYYQPNNAVLAISGNVDAEEAFALAEKIFSFESTGMKTIKYSPEPLQTENRQMTVERDVPSEIIMITFPICKRDDKEYYLFDILSDLLSNGKSSRMYNDLVVEKNAFTGIDAVVSGDDDNGLFIVLGKLADETKMENAEELIWQELQDIVVNPPSDYEFQKVKNKNIASRTCDNIRILDKAMNLAYYDHINILDRINTDNEIYSLLKIEDVVALAQRTFFENCHNTLYYRKKQN